jgi:hypothetical protein
MTEKNRCPLCGAHLTASQVLDAASELIDVRLGVLASQCPHCQGRLELRPLAGAVELGYLFGTATARFEVALALPCDGLEIHRDEENGTLRLVAPGREWSFAEE